MESPPYWPVVRIQRRKKLKEDLKKFTVKSFRSWNTSRRVCVLHFLLVKHPKTVRWKHNSCLSASKCYLESDAGGILDLKRHFLPIQRDLSGVERPWRGRKSAGGCMNEWIDKVGFSSLEQSVSKCCYFFSLLALTNVPFSYYRQMDGNSPVFAS